MIVALFGLLLVVHGLIHLGWIAPKPDDPGYPFRLSEPKVFRRAEGETVALVGAVLVVVSTVALVIAGFALWIVPEVSMVWRVSAIVGAATSLLVVFTFWHRWFLVAPLLDIVIIVAAILGWPTA